MISQREVYLYPHAVENTFIGVMITSSDQYNDDLSFPLSNEMFEQDLPKVNSKARMHLITLCFGENKIGPRLNVMKDYYFKKLMKHIGEIVFNYSFKPIIIEEK